MKIGPEEAGLFKKWKQEEGRSKKQIEAKNKVVEEGDTELVSPPSIFKNGSWQFSIIPF